MRRRYEAGNPALRIAQAGRDRVTGADGYLCSTCQASSAAADNGQDFPLSARYVVIDMPGGYPG